MLKVSSENRADQLNAIEAINDFARKVNTATSRAFLSYDQDADGCATLVLHVVGPGVEEAKSLADCVEQLKRVTAEVEALLPKSEPPAKKTRAKSGKPEAEATKEEVPVNEQAPAD